MKILVHDKEILKKYNEIWNKMNSLFKKELDSEPLHNDKYIKTKMRLYNMNFYSKKTPIEGKHYTDFSGILLDSIVNIGKKYYPQIFLNECKYKEKKKKDNEYN